MLQQATIQRLNLRADQSLRRAEELGSIIDKNEAGKRVGPHSLGSVLRSPHGLLFRQGTICLCVRTNLPLEVKVGFVAEEHAAQLQ